jgi:uncharacterized protein YycO
MKTITIGFSKSKKKFAVGSWLIRWYMETPYSHVYVKFHSESLNRTLIYEAVGSGVRFVGMSKWSSHAEEVATFDIQVSDDKYLELIRYCIDNAGVEYGFMQNIGIVLSGLFKEKFNRFNKGMNCSETSYNIGELAGLNLQKDKNLITPKDLYDKLSTL